MKSECLFDFLILSAEFIINEVDYSEGKEYTTFTVSSTVTKVGSTSNFPGGR
ncbi:MAG: hypothetical protein JXA77_10600 [Bacteroidales bacterium]|nr:hypothetical protein [Bacteroidales bacterium]MBN2820524.1 hypothetical protein [Bacteroidales bacterium]